MAERLDEKTKETLDTIAGLLHRAYQRLLEIRRVPVQLVDMAVNKELAIGLQPERS